MALTTTLSVMSDIQRRNAESDGRYGPFASTHEALGVALEEWDELRAAVHRNHMPSVRDECLDLASVLIRLVMAIDDREPSLLNRSTK